MAKESRSTTDHDVETDKKHKELEQVQANNSDLVKLSWD